SSVLSAIENVEYVSPKANTNMLSGGDILRQSELHLRNASSAKGVAAQVTKGPRSRYGKRGGVHPFSRSGADRRSERDSIHVIRPFFPADCEVTRHRPVRTIDCDVERKPRLRCS